MMKKKSRKRRASVGAGGEARTRKGSKKAARKESRTRAKTAARRKRARKKTPGAPGKGSREEGYAVETLVGLPKAPRTPSGLQSGDLQGLSNKEIVDSESVDELLEEGNAFEAGIVAGVEDSRNKGDKEVRTQEVPVDDVPGEYLDED